MDWIWPGSSRVDIHPRDIATAVRSGIRNAALGQRTLSTLALPTPSRVDSYLTYLNNILNPRTGRQFHRRRAPRFISRAINKRGKSFKRRPRFRTRTPRFRRIPRRTFRRTYRRRRY